VSEKTHLTTTEIAARYGAPAWLVRRVVDGLGADVPRAGLYRIVPVELLPRIEAALVEAGSLRRKEAAPCPA
jgi:hypothetical protein